MARLVTIAPCVTEVTTARYRGFDLITVAHRGKCTCGWRGTEHREHARAAREAIRHGSGR